MFVDGAGPCGGEDERALDEAEVGLGDSFRAPKGETAAEIAGALLPLGYDDDVWRKVTGAAWLRRHCREVSLSPGPRPKDYVLPRPVCCHNFFWRAHRAFGGARLFVGLLHSRGHLGQPLSSGSGLALLLMGEWYVYS